MQIETSRVYLNQGPRFQTLEAFRQRARSSGDIKEQLPPNLITRRDVSFFKKIRQEFSKGKLPKGTTQLNEYLSGLGVTDDRINPFSAFSFRECILKCIENYKPEVAA